MKDQVKSGFLLDVVVGKCSSIFQLLSSEDETLLIWWDSFLVLDFSLNIFDCIRCFNFERDGFSCQSFDEDLHSSSQTKDQVKSGFLLDVVVGKSSSIFQLLSCEDETLLIWWDSFLVLDFSFNIFDGIRCFNFKRDGFSCQSFDKDLHSSSQTKNQMESGLLLDVVVGKCSAIFQLLSSENETLLI